MNSVSPLGDPGPDDACDAPDGLFACAPDTEPDGDEPAAPLGDAALDGGVLDGGPPDGVVVPDGGVTPPGVGVGVVVGEALTQLV